MGALRKGLFRANAYYYHFYSNRYCDKDNFEEHPSYDKTITNYMGGMLGYGLFKRITLEGEFGYYIDKTQYLKDHLVQLLKIKYIRLEGLSRASISLKYSIYSNVKKRFGCSAGLGSIIPFQTDMEFRKNNPMVLWPSNGSYGILAQGVVVKENSFTGLRFFLIHRLETYFKNKHGYKFGNTYTTSLFISKHLWFPWTTGDGIWTAIVQLRNEYRDRVVKHDTIVPTDYSYIFYLSPQLNMTIMKMVNVSLIVDIPFYQYYETKQMAGNYAATLSLTVDIYKKDEPQNQQQPAE